MSEPCENCATPVRVFETAIPALWERRGAIDKSATVFRPHEPERCREARRQRETR